MIESFRVLCAADGWVLRLWGDEDARTLSMVNRSHFDASESLGLRSDLMRYEVCGGLALAFPIICFHHNALAADFVPAGGCLRGRRLRVRAAHRPLPPTLHNSRTKPLHLILWDLKHRPRLHRGK